MGCRGFLSPLYENPALLQLGLETFAMLCYNRIENCGNARHNQKG